MCDKAIDTCLIALSFVPYWFVTNKIITDGNLFSSDDTIFVNDHIFSVDLNNINLGDNEAKTIIFLILIA